MGLCASSAQIVDAGGEGGDAGQPSRGGLSGNSSSTRTMPTAAVGAHHAAQQQSRKHGARTNNHSSEERQQPVSSGSKARAGTRCVLGQQHSGDDVRSRYVFERVLGKGQFGVTRLVVDIATGEQCACKSISKRKLVTDEDVEVREAGGFLCVSKVEVWDAAVCKMPFPPPPKLQRHNNKQPPLKNRMFGARSR